MQATSIRLVPLADADAIRSRDAAGTLAQADGRCDFANRAGTARLIVTHQEQAHVAAVSRLALNFTGGRRPRRRAYRRCRARVTPPPMLWANEVTIWEGGGGLVVSLSPGMNVSGRVSSWARSAAHPAAAHAIESHAASALRTTGHRLGVSQVTHRRVRGRRRAGHATSFTGGRIHQFKSTTGRRGRDRPADRGRARSRRARADVYRHTLDP